MNRISGIIALVLISIAWCGSDDQGTKKLAVKSASGPTRSPVKLVGTRNFTVGDKTLGIPWYRLDADYHAISTAGFWNSVKAPAGTKTAYVGHYGDVEWCKWFDDQSHAMMRARGLEFIVPDEYRVTPGPGAVSIRWWLYEEQTQSDTMAFRDGRYYVFCLDREPLQQWLNAAKEPGCDMDTELQHSIAIIEIHPTFIFSSRPSSGALYLSRNNLLCYRQERYNGQSSSYDLEFAVLQKESNQFEFQIPQGHFSAQPEVMQKLLYAVTTCTWQQQKQSHRFESPAVVRTSVEYLDDKSARKTAIIEYDNGSWHLKYPEKKYYATVFPHLLYEVKKDIITAYHPK